LPGVLLLPLGLAAIVVVSQLLTAGDATAELATPAVTAGGAAGLLAGRAWRRVRCLDGWAAVAAAAVFLVYAAPAFSGSAAFAGYGQLGDIADHFVVVDWMTHMGKATADSTASAYEMAVAAYPGQGYPTGMHTALGALRPLTGQDVPWSSSPSWRS